MKKSSFTFKFCLFAVLVLSLFTPLVAMAQWGGGGYYSDYYYEESWSDCTCGGNNGGGWGGYFPPIGGCNYSPINYDD